MKFEKTEADENFTIARWVSENNVWEIGLHQMLFGIRVRGSIVGCGYCSIDYCAGSDKGFALVLLATMVRIMMCLPETITPRELENLLPKYERRPINLDPCWQKLLNLASELEETNTSSDADKVFVLTEE